MRVETAANSYMCTEAPAGFGADRTDFDRMQQVVIVIHLMLVLAMIGVVLLQRSEGGGLGIGSTAAAS